MNDNTLVKGFLIVAAIVFGLVGLPLVALYSAWAGAFVGVHLWIWFVVPIFHIAPLTMPQAFGLAMLINFWTYHFKAGVKDVRENKEKYIELIGIVIFPWSTLLTGYICHQFFM